MLTIEEHATIMLIMKVQNHLKPILAVALVAAVLLVLIGMWWYQQAGQKQVAQKQEESTPITNTQEEPAPITNTQNVPAEVPSTKEASAFKTDILPHYESIFSYPYPVVWKGGNVAYSIVGASLGEARIPPDAQIPNNPTNRNIKDSQGNYYPVGSEVYALRLYVKPSNSNYNYNDFYDPYFDMKRVLNEEGDVVGTSIKGIASTLGPGKIINGTKAVEVWFIVPEGEKDFTISTGKRSITEIFFGVSGQQNGSIKIENYTTGNLQG